MSVTSRLKVKICLIGDTNVGKTSLIRRYVMDIFDDKYITTLGTKVSKKQIVIKRSNDELFLLFSIWDVLGQESFKKIQNVAFKGSQGALLVCDLTRKQTLENLANWNQRLTDATGKIPKIVLANKSDLIDKHKFTDEQLQEYSSRLDAPYFKTSAKFGDNVIRAFFKLGEFIADDVFKSTKRM
jgi:small GTP-binding protein